MFKKFLLIAALALGLSVPASAQFNPNTLTAPSSVSLNAHPYPSLTVVTPQMFGAKCDGTTNDVTAFNQALSTGYKIQINSGNCFLGSTVTLPSNTWIEGYNGAQISFDASSHYGFISTSTANLKVTGVSFLDTTSTASANFTVFGFTSVSNIWLEFNTTAPGLGLLITGSTAANYAGVNSGNLTQDVHILRNNIGSGTTSNTGSQPCLALYYSTRFEVIGNSISGCTDGVFWWGGDSDPSVDGALANTRWAQGGVVSANVVHDIGSGCIWGSMGQSITITGNTVTNCADVGLDNEGGNSISFIGNSCTNASNGCLTTFNLPTAALFSGNNVTQSSGPLARIYNSSLNPLTTSVTFTGNIFRWTGSNLGSIDTNNGPVNVLSFDNNTVINAVVNFASTNQHIINVKNNHFTYTVVPASPFNAVNVTNYATNGNTSGVANIIGNDFSSSVVQSSSSYSISVTATDSNVISFASIMNNQTLMESACDIHWTNSVTNAGVFPAFSINNNVIRGCYTRTESGASISQGLLQNNSDQVGTYFPSPANIGTTRWDAGQIFLTRPPSAGGFIGQVQTTSGAPGTQKTYGVISP